MGFGHFATQALLFFLARHSFRTLRFQYVRNLEGRYRNIRPGQSCMHATLHTISIQFANLLTELY